MSKKPGIELYKEEVVSLNIPSSERKGYSLVIECWGKTSQPGQLSTTPEEVENDALFLQSELQKKGVRLGFLRQTHTATAIEAHTLSGLYWLPKAMQEPEAPEADAAFSNAANTGIAIRTADCMPLVFYHPTRLFWGAIHSGWRGFQQKIIFNTLAAAQTKFNQNETNELRWVAGPFIGASHYEVGSEFAEYFSGDLQKSPENKRLCLDMKSVLLRQLGLEPKGETEAPLESPEHPKIRFIDGDTWSEEGLYSHRRGDAGRNFTVAYIRDEAPKRAP